MKYKKKKRKELRGVVYVMSDTSNPGVYKIGYTDDVNKRLYEFNHNTCSQSTFDLHILWHVPERIYDRKLLHKVLDTINEYVRVEKKGQYGESIKSEFYNLSLDEIWAIFTAIALINDDPKHIFRTKVIDGVIYELDDNNNFNEYIPDTDLTYKKSVLERLDDLKEQPTEAMQLLINKATSNFKSHQQSYYQLLDALKQDDGAVNRVEYNLCFYMSDAIAALIQDICDENTSQRYKYKKFNYEEEALTVYFFVTSILPHRHTHETTINDLPYLLDLSCNAVINIHCGR